MSVKELYDQAHLWFFKRPRAKGLRVIIEVETTLKDKNRVETYVTLLNEKGIQEKGKGHPRAYFADSTSYTVKQYLGPIIDMLIQETLDAYAGDGEEVREAPTGTAGDR